MLPTEVGTSRVVELVLVSGEPGRVALFASIPSHEDYTGMSVPCLRLERYPLGVGVGLDCSHPRQSFYLFGLVACNRNQTSRGWSGAGGIVYSCESACC